MEIALNRDKGLLSVIQHQPFYSSYPMNIQVWASPDGHEQEDGFKVSLQKIPQERMPEGLNSELSTGLVEEYHIKLAQGNWATN